MHNTATPHRTPSARRRTTVAKVAKATSKSENAATLCGIHACNGSTLSGTGTGTGPGTGTTVTAVWTLVIPAVATPHRANGDPLSCAESIAETTHC
eukprot:4580126-Prymnesium_polylepis.1